MGDVVNTPEIDTELVLNLIHHAALTYKKGVVSNYGRTLLATEMHPSRPGYIDKKLDESCPTHELKVTEFLLFLEKVEQASGLQIVDVICHGLGGKFTTRTEAITNSIFAAILDVGAAQGDVDREVSQAMADGEIDAQEKRKILQRFSEMEHKIATARNTLMATDEAAA